MRGCDENANMPAGGQKATVKNEEAVPSMRQVTRGVDPYDHEQEQSAKLCQLFVNRQHPNAESQKNESGC